MEQRVDEPLSAFQTTAWLASGFSLRVRSDPIARTPSQVVQYHTHHVPGSARPSQLIYFILYLLLSRSFEQQLIWDFPTQKSILALQFAAAWKSMSFFTLSPLCYHHLRNLETKQKFKQTKSPPHTTPLLGHHVIGKPQCLRMSIQRQQLGLVVGWADAFWIKINTSRSSVSVPTISSPSHQTGKTSYNMR